MILCSCDAGWASDWPFTPDEAAAMVAHHNASHRLRIGIPGSHSVAQIQDIRVRLLEALMPLVVPEYIEPAAWRPRVFVHRNTAEDAAAYWTQQIQEALRRQNS